LFAAARRAYNRIEMPRKRRPARSSQRRAPRRPEFAAGPVQPAPEKTDLDGQPIFADDVSVPSATAHFGISGPVETRPEWIGSTAPQQPQRQPGRRTAQLRQRGTSEGAARIMASQLPTFERSYIVDELRRIAIISGALFALVIVLALVMR
jgi:hypothetical protein